ncbi:2581_t:CDS:2 [Paraglomus brasilianum]|uniref:2581_t:CDS:1 n=1 Tax=Paraglomus brasilianum TaxID=144538 RepID=A0A9N9DU56_9GLOM|nr:2581_t:CDS:2 [Paraglomus brasilianum]
MDAWPILNADVIQLILNYLSIRELQSALLVNRLWCRAALPIYWKAPFSYTAKRSRVATKTYELFLERTVSTRYDYPSMLKELNFTNLLATLDEKDCFTKINKILQMLLFHGVRLESFIMDNSGTKHERVYASWATPVYAPIFSSLSFVKIRTPFQKTNVLKMLAKSCTTLFHLDMHLHDNSTSRVDESLCYLNELISAQTCLLSLRLVFPNGLGRKLFPILQAHPERFKRIELVKWNFRGCEWPWLAQCPNLIEFALTSYLARDLEDVLGTNHEPHRLQASKSSRLTTAHWHLKGNDEKFYFHPDESSLEPYDDIPPPAESEKGSASRTRPRPTIRPKSMMFRSSHDLKGNYSALIDKLLSNMLSGNGNINMFSGNGNIYRSL